MSENKYTPEPWRTVSFYMSGRRVGVEDGEGNPVCYFHSDSEKSKENARRIVACVNACAGISQQYLEELNGETLADKQMVLITQRDEYSLLAYRRQNILDEVIKQRDELLAALEKLTDVFATIGITSGLYDDEQDALKAACDVIASVKGGAE